MNLDSQGQVVLDRDGNPMEVGKYYSIGIGQSANIKYLGQWIDNKNFMRFQQQNGIIIRRVIEPLAINRPQRVEPLDEGGIDTDNEDQLDDTNGGRRKTKKRRSITRKTKKRRHSKRKRYNSKRKRYNSKRK